DYRADVAGYIVEVYEQRIHAVPLHGTEMSSALYHRRGHHIDVQHRDDDTIMFRGGFDLSDGTGVTDDRHALLDARCGSLVNGDKVDHPVDRIVDDFGTYILEAVNDGGVGIALRAQ